MNFDGPKGSLLKMKPTKLFSATMKMIKSKCNDTAKMSSQLVEELESGLTSVDEKLLLDKMPLAVDTFEDDNVELAENREKLADMMGNLRRRGYWMARFENPRASYKKYVHILLH